MPRQTLDIVFVAEDDLIKKVKGEINPKHPVIKGDTLKRAVNRWATSKGYGGAITSGSIYRGQYRVICFLKEVVDVRDASLAELAEFHGENLNTAASRWASSNKQYASGWLNGEAKDDRRGIICLKELKNQFGLYLFKYNNVKRSEIEHSPDPECDDRVMRWGIDRGYLAAMPNHEADAEYIGVVCALPLSN